MSKRSVLRSRTYLFRFGVTGVTVGDSARDPALEAAFQSELPTTNVDDAVQIFDATFAEVGIHWSDHEVKNSSTINANLEEMQGYALRVNNTLGQIDSPASPLHHGNFQPVAELNINGSLDEATTFNQFYGGFLGEAVATHWKHVGDFNAISGNVTKINTAYYDTDLKHAKKMNAFTAGFQEGNAENNLVSTFPADYRGKNIENFVAPDQNDMTQPLTGSYPESASSLGVKPVKDEKPPADDPSQVSAQDML
jgi:hypothetical protein